MLSTQGRSPHGCTALAVGCCLHPAPPLLVWDNVFITRCLQETQLITTRCSGALVLHPEGSRVRKLVHPTYYKLDFLHLQAVFPCLYWDSSYLTAIYIPSDRQTCWCSSLYLQIGTSIEKPPAPRRRSPKSQINKSKAEGNGVAQAGVPPGMVQDTCSSQ